MNSNVKNEIPRGSTRCNSVGCHWVPKTRFVPEERRRVPEVDGIDHGATVDDRDVLSRRELAYRHISGAKVRAGKVVGRRMKRRQQEHHLDAARVQLLYERGDDRGGGRRWAGVADVGEESAGGGDDPGIRVRAPRGDPVSEQR